MLQTRSQATSGGAAKLLEKVMLTSADALHAAASQQYTSFRISFHCN